MAWTRIRERVTVAFRNITLTGGIKHDPEQRALAIVDDETGEEEALSINLGAGRDVPAADRAIPLYEGVKPPWRPSGIVFVYAWGRLVSGPSGCSGSLGRDLLAQAGWTGRCLASAARGGVARMCREGLLDLEEMSIDGSHVGASPG